MVGHFEIHRSILFWGESVRGRDREMREREIGERYKEREMERV